MSSLNIIKKILADLSDNRAKVIPAGAFRAFINKIRSLRQQIINFRLRALSPRLRRPRNAILKSDLEFMSIGEKPAAEKEKKKEKRRRRKNYAFFRIKIYIIKAASFFFIYFSGLLYFCRDSGIFLFAAFFKINIYIITAASAVFFGILIKKFSIFIKR